MSADYREGDVPASPPEQTKAPEPASKGLSNDGISAMQGYDNSAEAEPQPLRFGELEPNQTYERNGHQFTTDDQGRIVAAQGRLQLKEGERTKHQTEVGKKGGEGDEGGHLIGTRFAGTPEGPNLVPQNANLNRGEWKSMENEWATCLAEGKQVEVGIQPVYEGNNPRPTAFSVIYEVTDEDGSEITERYFKNAPHGLASTESKRFDS